MLMPPVPVELEEEPARTLPDVALTTVRVYGVRESIVGRHWYRHRYQLKIVWINP